ALASRADPLPAEWSTEVSLGPLTPPETIDLAAALCRTQPDLADKVAEIAAESEGSPLFLGELVRFMGDREVIDPWQSVKPSLTSVLETRARSLTSSERLALEVVAVAGAPIDREAAMAAMSEANGQAGAAMASLERQRLLRTTTSGGHPAVE